MSCDLKMIRSAENIEEYQKKLSSEEITSIKDIFSCNQKKPGSRLRKEDLQEINTRIVDTAIRTNNPKVLCAIQDLEGEDIDILYRRMVSHFIQTKDPSWLKSLLSLSDKLGKKSGQSHVLATMARDIVDAGVTGRDPELIDSGLGILEKICFRKYRSIILIEIVPLLISRIISTHDQDLLSRSFRLIEEINDISKRALIHSDLAKTMAIIAIAEKDQDLFVASIRKATQIHQMARRQECFVSIIVKGSKSVLRNNIVDITHFLENFPDLSQENLVELIRILVGQILEDKPKKEIVLPIFLDLCENMPFASEAIIVTLLEKAEQTGDLTCFSTAMELMQIRSFSEKYPIKEVIRSGISVARHLNDMHILLDLIAVIERNCPPEILSGIYLQFSQIMLDSEDFSAALYIINKINPQIVGSEKYNDTLIHLLKVGILKNNTPLINNMVLKRMDSEIASSSIYRAVIEVSHDYQFKDLITRIHSINYLILLHPLHDSLLLESITILVDRGFLDSCDPTILIRLAESIGEEQLKDYAISNIVKKIAKISVRAGNRDLLQRAIGLTCLITDQNARSTALISIIDDASVLAVQDGDLDLLLRMKEWSSSLLERDLAACALVNIIKGVIKYSIDKFSADALEKACIIVSDINDPSLKTELFERIAESFVKIGCISLGEIPSVIKDTKRDQILTSFERGLDVIRQNVAVPQISLKIAGMIDIILSYSRISENEDYIIPLAMYSIEIKNSFERDAMLSRIVSNLNENIHHPDSADPYEIITFILKGRLQGNFNPVIDNLLFQVILQIADPFVKLTSMCYLSDLALKSHKNNRACEILEYVHDSLGTLTNEYQRIWVLCDLASISGIIDIKSAKRYLESGMQKLDVVEPEQDSISRRRIVDVIATLNMINPDDELIKTVPYIIEKITDPVDYIQSLMILYNIERPAKARSEEIIRKMNAAIDKIDSPYEKTSFILEYMPFSLEICGEVVTFSLLKETCALIGKINIQHIADTIRGVVAEFLITLYHKYSNEKYLNYALDVIKSIEDPEERHYNFKKYGQKETIDVSSVYCRFKALMKDMTDRGIHPQQLTALERLIRTEADRGDAAIYFCNLAIFLKMKGEKKLSHRMIQNAIKESSIIRPLPKRSFVMCNIAIKINIAGCKRTAHEILDLAIDAATNIRQAKIRDSVFDELDQAMKIVPGM
jgi:hypothetical protein